MDDRISELPDCILSDIQKKLPMKDLVKTSILSKKWYTLWALRIHLCFDIFNVLGNLNELLQNQYLIDRARGVDFPCSFGTVKRYVNLDLSRGEFVKRVDQFVKKFSGAKIDSLLVNFCLGYEQNKIIDQWINFAIARGVERIDLLFLGRPYAPLVDSTQQDRYNFDFALFSASNASTLNHLRLENCLVCQPTNCDFTQFQNLRSLLLEEVKLDESFIESLLSNCQRLQELCLLICEFKSSMPVIESSSLCHLKVKGCYVLSNNHKLILNLISLECLNLTSLELDCLVHTSSDDGLDTLNFHAPMLKNIKFFISLKQKLNSFVARCATFFPKVEIMHVTTFTMDTTSLQITQPFKHLRQLNLIIFVNAYILDDVDYDPLWILNILQAVPLLHKLSVMFRASKFSENQKDIRDVERLSHNEVKVVELGGCVGNWYEIELVMNVLKYVHKLEQIVVSPYWRENDSLNWMSDPEGFESGYERMREKLQGQEVVGREKLVFID